MSTFAASLEERARKPVGTVTVPAEAFADEWADKPDSEVEIGLRLLSEADIQTARAQAARYASELYLGKDGDLTDAEARTDAYNDALVRWVVARATCDPNDISIPYFEAAEDTVRFALTSEGVRRIWDTYVALHLCTGVGLRVATDENLRELGTRLHESDALASLPYTQALEIRKLLAHCLDVLRAPFVEDLAEET